MSARERFLRVLNFEKPGDRLPLVEWAAWWNKTIERWKQEGLPETLTWDESLEHFGLDKLVCLYARGLSGERPASAVPGAPLVTDEKSYDVIRPYLFTDAIVAGVTETALALKPRHDRGEIIIRLWLDGFFWFPRTLFGIEPHLYAFHDQPGLMHRMNRDLAAFNERIVAALFPILKPDMIGFAEDCSYNLGPMLSRDQFREFLTPYYHRVVPFIKKHGVKVLADSDGNITPMIPWMIEAGLEGVYPLERQSGVDVAGIRRDYPAFLMLGGYDKMVMCRGGAAMRAEFERLLPVMRSGGFIPSVDHQTPPGVSLENYRVYVNLLKEYCAQAAA